MAALLAISMILFTQEKNQKRMFWYYGNMILTSFALIMGSSDNAYLSLAAIFGLAPLWLFQTKTGLRRYVISLATFFTVILASTESIRRMRYPFSGSTVLFNLNCGDEVSSRYL